MWYNEPQSDTIAFCKLAVFELEQRGEIPRSVGGEVCRCGRYQKMEMEFQGAAEIKTREGAAAERSIGAGGVKKWKRKFL